MAARWATRCLRSQHARFISTASAPRLSTAEIVQMCNELFTKEKARQLSLHPRIEKIEVKYVSKSHPGTVFVMNKALSTPYNCAMHLSEWHCKKSVLALVDGELWDMYRPLTKSCEIQFLTFKDENPEEVNKAYWRSCSMILACVLKQAFKDEYSVSLIRAPEVPVISGAFCYDVVLDSRLDDWKPTQDNFRSLTKEAYSLILKDLPFETLHVEAKVALEMFQHNRYKMDSIEQKASQNPERIVKLHRFGDFVDISEGPHIPRTSFCFQYEVTAAHNLRNSQPASVRRFQGVSLPVHLKAHHTVWRRLLERSQRLVTEDCSPKAKDVILEAKMASKHVMRTYEKLEGLRSTCYRTLLHGFVLLALNPMDPVGKRHLTESAKIPPVLSKPAPRDMAVHGVRPNGV